MRSPVQPPHSKGRKPPAGRSENRRLRRTVEINPRYCSFPLRVGKSRIHRRGVFAETTIPRGYKVIEYAGQRIGKREAERRLLKIWGAKGSKIVDIFRLTPSRFVDGAVRGSGAELINHSCDPNLVATHRRGHILYVSRRRISAGEELSVDYRFPRDGMRIACHCGARRCRGTINLQR